jgi:hypothetical protein
VHNCDRPQWPGGLFLGLLTEKSTGAFQLHRINKCAPGCGLENKINLQNATSYNKQAENLNFLSELTVYEESRFISKYKEYPLKVKRCVKDKLVNANKRYLR